MGHESVSRAPRRHAPPRPGSGGHSPYIKQAPITSAPKLPGGWTPCTLFPPAHSRNALPRGPLKLDSMDSTGPLGVLLLPLLLMGTALGNGAQKAPGIGGSGDPLFAPRFRRGRQRGRCGCGVPCTHSLRPAFPRPLSHRASRSRGEGHSCGSLYFLSLQNPLCWETVGQKSPGRLLPSWRRG